MINELAKITYCGIVSAVSFALSANADYAFYPDGYAPQGTVPVSAPYVMTTALEPRYRTVAVSDGKCHVRGLTIIVR